MFKVLTGSFLGNDRRMVRPCVPADSRGLWRTRPELQGSLLIAHGSGEIDLRPDHCSFCDDLLAAMFSLKDSVTEFQLQCNSIMLAGPFEIFQNIQYFTP